MPRLVVVHSVSNIATCPCPLSLCHHIPTSALPLYFDLRPLFLVSSSHRPLHAGLRQRIKGARPVACAGQRASARWRDCALPRSNVASPFSVYHASFGGATPCPILPHVTVPLSLCHHIPTSALPLYFVIRPLFLVSPSQRPLNAGLR
eukprot:8918905-Pyramimonas_sp.AAC.1